GENIDILNGNVNLSIPIGPRYQLNDWFGYQVTLYYNSKVWINECDPFDQQNCSGQMATDRYGLGWDIHFGRIYHHPDDRNDLTSGAEAQVFRYQTSDGAEHFFCIGNGCAIEGVTLDASSMHIAGDPSNGWEVWPGDGTVLLLDHDGGNYNPKEGEPEGGMYTRRIETVARDTGDADPQQFVEITYDATNPVIDFIEDSAGRKIEFRSDSIGRHIDLPAFGNKESVDLSYVATYTLVYSGLDIHDPEEKIGASPAIVSANMLGEIWLPELNPTAPASERYAFSYDQYGSLTRWDLPTGAWIDYTYDYYRTSQKKPLHSELFFKTLHFEEEEYRWSYSRFGGTPRTLDEAIDQYNGEYFTGSNPDQVNVLDPFGNLTIYFFAWTPLNENDCDVFGCKTGWRDGKLTRVDTFAGPDIDGFRFLRTELYEHTFDDTWVQFRPNSTKANANSVAVNARQIQTEVVTYGGSEFSTQTHKTVQSDWTNVNASGVIDPSGSPMARKRREYKDGQLYRTSITNYPPQYGLAFPHKFRNRHDFVEIQDAAGSVVSRTDKRFVDNRLECQVRRQDRDAKLIASCDDDEDLGVDPGDVVVRNYYNGDTGNRTHRTVRGGDDATAYSTAYEYNAGVTQQKSHGTYADEIWTSPFNWDAVDRTIDRNTGLVIASRDPGEVETSYDWDKLGRLRGINFGAGEAPLEIIYENLHHTIVERTVSPGNFTRETYSYDDLGRLIREERRNLSGAMDFRETEYDISGRVTRQSEWTAEGVAATAWTEYEYRFAVPNPGPDDPPFFIDPLGRVSKVTRPDGGTTTTSYEGLASRVTVYGIEGNTGVIDAETTYVNDDLGRLVTVDSPDSGADAVYLYDERDNLVEVQLSDPDAGTGIDPQVRRFVYDGLGRLRQASNPENGTVEYGQYDPRGKLLEWQDAAGNAFRNAYDAAGRLETKSIKFGTNLQPLVENTYDAYQVTIPGSVGSAAGKLTRQVSSRIDGSQTLPVSTRWYGYGASGDCPAVQGTIPGEEAYQGLNGRPMWLQMQIEPWAEPLSINLCQDPLGNEYSVEYPFIENPDYPGETDPPLPTKRTSVKWLRQNGVVWEVHDEDRGIQYISNVEYNAQSAITRFVRGNGLINTVARDLMARPHNFEIWQAISGFASYQPLDEVIGCGSPGGQNPEVPQLCLPPTPPTFGSPFDVLWDSGAYAYDQAGNVKAIGGDSYRYDALQRLTAAAVQGHVVAYGYDSFGNMTARNKRSPGGVHDDRTYAVDTATNRLFEMQIDAGVTTSYAFDPNGNMTDAGSQHYTFDAQNRLTDVLGAGGTTVARYDYDASGYRIRSEAGDTETFYFRDDTGRVLTEYARGLGDETDPSWNKDYIYALGQTVAMVKNDVPEAPGRPWATSVSPSSVTLTWNEIDEPDLRGYELYRWVDGVETTFNVDELPFTDNLNGVTMHSDIEFFYSVAATDWAQNKSARSAELLVEPLGTAPSKPAGLTAIAQDRAVLLQWAAGTEADLWGYHVERQGPGAPANPRSEPWHRVTTMPVAGPSFLDFGLPNDELYNYQVIAIDTSGRMSAPSDPVLGVVPIDNVPPARPQGVSVRAGLDVGTLEVRWSAVFDPDPIIYTVTRTHPGEASVVISPVSSPFLDGDTESLDGGEEYTYT
ncbi:MAG: hypothetical protein GY722_27730, partial [bacterium]|nr:hypothetical protein [bacterium]